MFNNGWLRIIENDKESIGDVINQEAGKRSGDDMMQEIKNKEATDATDTSVKDEYVTRSLIIEDECRIDRYQSEMWSNEWIQNTAIAAESIIVLDLMTMVVQNVGREEERLLKVHTDCEEVHELLITERFKASQCELHRGSIISKIIETEIKVI